MLALATVTTAFPPLERRIAARSARGAWQATERRAGPATTAKPQLERRRGDGRWADRPVGQAPSGGARARRGRAAGACPRTLLQGLRPVDGKRIPTEVIAGITLAALAIPEVMGYSKIAGMPVITGLYTILLPVDPCSPLWARRATSWWAPTRPRRRSCSPGSRTWRPGLAAYVALAGMTALIAAACCWRRACCAWASSPTSFRAPC